MTKAHLATRGHVFPVGKLDFTEPLKNFKTIKTSGVNPLRPQRIITRPLCWMERWQRLCAVVVVVVVVVVGGDLAVVLCCWQACDSPAIEDKGTERTGLIHRWPSLQERTTGQHNRTDRTHRHQRRRTPSSSRCSQLYHCSHWCYIPLHLHLPLRLAPSPSLSLSLSPQRSLSRSPPPHLQHLSPTVPTVHCSARRTPLSDLNRGKITAGYFLTM